MTNYIKFLPQIASYFNVTPAYVSQVFQSAQLTEATTWTHMIQIWVVVTFVMAVISGIFLAWGDNDKKGAFIAGACAGGVVFGIIAAFVLSDYGGYLIQIAQPEYMTWINYASQLQLAPS